ncbi:uncharacterized protein Bfra_008307 [Botrytis fragariae]|uniref:Uncharacterized protein n=1 Tax=Botrytis fragariae TaxID=1964551 RepID=A0A8H6EIE7_9HELO|nr:uncharacterized protein Bfra_008307 [Botrytis fragariae]KAF5873030.1 hypothetical protein Bfra_008307 [Botrytis fragariae]
MASSLRTPVNHISPPKRRKRTELKADLECIFSYFNLTEKSKYYRRFSFGTGHHYTHYYDGGEMYVDSDGIGIYVDITGHRSLYIRPKKEQEAMRRRIEQEIRHASDLEWLKYKARGFFAERAVRELGILELRR